MNMLTMPLLAALLFLQQVNETMPHPIAQLLFENAGVIVLAGSTATALLIRVLSKRLASRQVNAARIEAAEANRKAEEIKNDTELKEQETQTKIELLRLEIEKNRIEAVTLETAQKTNQDLLALLTRQTELQEQAQETQKKNTDTLSDFGRVLSSNSSVLVGNVEEIGELRMAVVAHDANTSEQLQQVINAVNGLVASVNTIQCNHKEIMEAIEVLTVAAEVCKKKVEDTGEQPAVVEPLDAPSPLDKAS